MSIELDADSLLVQNMRTGDEKAFEIFVKKILSRNIEILSGRYALKCFNLYSIGGNVIGKVPVNNYSLFEIGNVGA